jgi:hypothetical protein
VLVNSCFISSQTPTFNAPAVVDATLAAIRKGKEITLFLDLGFNDGVSLSRYHLSRCSLLIVTHSRERLFHSRAAQMKSSLRRCSKTSSQSTGSCLRSFGTQVSEVYQGKSRHHAEVKFPNSQGYVPAYQCEQEAAKLPR